MSAIKRFFEKKKADAKFKLAGGGQKLGDAASAQDAAQRRAAALASAQNRAGPSGHRNQSQLNQGQRLAASAALNRVAKSQNESADDFEKRRSQARIREQAKKELEKEQEIQREIQKMKDTYGEKPTVELEAPMAGGSGNSVLYKCPLIGDQVLPKEEMREAIRNFLYSQLDEEPGLTSCLIIHTINKDSEKIQVCVNTLCKYMDNIIQNPSEEKFRKVRKSNKAYQERVAILEGSDIFLQAAGFITTTIEDQEFWLFPPQADVNQLELLKEALIGAEPIRAELDRGIKVLLPSQAQKPISLPPDFFNLTPEELKREQELKSDVAEQQLMLRTKAMREREEQKERRKYRFCLIRIRFPDGLVLQGTFSVYEKFKMVEEFVADNLEHPLPFLLHDAAKSGQVLENESLESSLSDLGLIPSSILSFAWHPDVAEEVKQQLGPNAAYLKDSIMALAKSD